MTEIYWLAAANAVLWIGLGLYIALVAAKQNALQKRLNLLENSHD